MEASTRIIVARVQPRTSKDITDLLLPPAFLSSPKVLIKAHYRNFLARFLNEAFRTNAAEQEHSLHLATNSITITLIEKA